MSDAFLGRLQIMHPNAHAKFIKMKKIMISSESKTYDVMVFDSQGCLCCQKDLISGRQLIEIMNYLNMSGSDGSIPICPSGR